MNHSLPSRRCPHSPGPLSSKSSISSASALIIYQVPLDYHAKFSVLASAFATIIVGIISKGLSTSKPAGL